ncbi:hypothetical protein MRB53_037753 [Persea americana]|nr:hypothetical protein MRB53_037753 [Persea americana]
MLLGYYEVTTADHMKWSTHLAGSKQLLSELNFTSMVKRLRQNRREQRLRLQTPSNMTLLDVGMLHPRDKADTVLDIDEGIISRLIGREVRYDEHGSVEDPLAPTVDLDKFDALRDLFWWYCKQDAFQALIGGNALLLDISRWTDCPPRSTLGATICGSADHLVLLLGRLAAFIASDRGRKRQVEARKQSRSSSSPNTSATASRSLGSTLPAGDAPPARGPAFYGMAPSRGDVEMPASYRSSHSPKSGAGRPASQDMDDATLQAATLAALDEHRQILLALDTFASHLGPAFQPLTPDLHHAPIATPFGPAISYRSADISCLWAMYHMAVIIAIRAHPHMPPAAHVAALVAARDTAHAANQIGRIVAALTPTPPTQPLNAHLAAALNESCVASFFAAVQYQDPRQRRATVARIYHIAARTGWASSELIANGCETAWINAAHAGLGPRTPASCAAPKATTPASTAAGRPSTSMPRPTSTMMPTAASSLSDRAPACTGLSASWGSPGMSLLCGSMTREGWGKGGKTRVGC